MESGLITGGQVPRQDKETFAEQDIQEQMPAPSLTSLSCRQHHAPCQQQLMFAFKAFYPIVAVALCMRILPTVQAASVNVSARADTTNCCGYVVTNRNNAYFRYRSIFDFAAMSSIDEALNAGWFAADGWQCGGANPYTGQVPIGSAKNVVITKGKGLVLTVPGQSKTAKTFSVAKVQFAPALLGGILEIEALLPSAPGTCTGIFSSHADAGLDKPFGWHDEHDIEMLSTSLLKQVGGQPAGLNMVNYDPTYLRHRYLLGSKSSSTDLLYLGIRNGTKAYKNQLFPAGIDPSKGFHTYSISWFPSTSDSNPAKMTEIRFDGKLQNAPRAFASTHPSSLIINHWTNGDDHWSGGPPTQNSALIVRKAVLYYDQPNAVAPGARVAKDTTCSQAKACQVTI
ncbi:hypothetical protein QFC22_006385 [Naganishia vaughanmartiniae]|uniref:Uncharacterized protein n=1 Tax=Naganishia vaughanmartiniae TaxID=1424756 RepID=A0ACC2WKY3_9TREE|nr:hypothetical protein QFC22_006385 [Naganishia vaughanmartiniae]